MPAQETDYRHAALAITVVNGETSQDLSNAPGGKDGGGRRVLALQGGRDMSTKDAEQNRTLLHRNQVAGLLARPGPCCAV